MGVASRSIAGAGAFLLGYGVDEGGLTENVKQSMQHEFNISYYLPFLTAQKVELIRTEGNWHEGVLTLATSKDDRHQVRATAENRSRDLWRLDQGALFQAPRS